MRKYSGPDPRIADGYDELRKRLEELCEEQGKSFQKMWAYANRIMDGKCGAVEAIGIVIRLLEPRTEEAKGMSVEECRDHLIEEADELERELAAISGKEAELKARIAKARHGADALGRVLEGKVGSPNAGVTHEKFPCEWPGCDRQIAKNGRRKHIEWHEERSGKTLDQALEESNVTPIAAGGR